MLRSTAIWIIRTAILVWSWPTLIAGSNPSGATITISIDDRAHIGSKTLERAEGVATGIFAVAGVYVHWTRSAAVEADLVRDFSTVPAGECARLPTSELVRVEILSRAPNGFAPQALGYSLPCARRGVQVTIYADRVEAVSSQTVAVFYRVLAYALLHELGHVLLRSLSHDQSGLMKAVWSKNDWQRAAVAAIPFTPDQARRMAEGLPRTKRAGDVR
jgi:hypothetical protein